MFYLIVTTDKELVKKARESGAGVFTANQSRVVETLNVEIPVAKQEFEWSKVDTLLKMLAIQPNVNGYDFIRHILQKCESCPNYHKKSYTKEIYPECAEAFGIAPNKIERCVRHAVEKSFESVPEVYEKLFGIKEKPNNSQFISWASVYLTRCK